ncbi:MAG: tRNA (N6-isopentenyl adenosine(37)-C2)-methylthiotransferase MiaB [Polymorphobacter sp.]|uniref:tRNA (N6-isopentenyl adenosine(37)-C2)-methylthiotransferase MiaB n=1 Tax=Polymorphobacter sp. TaxID=1909290 RepID=UPI003A8376C2
MRGKPSETCAHVTNQPARFHVKSFGCQMNVHDSERMSDLLMGEGMTAVDSADDADVIVLNTCHIREKATEKLFSDIGRIEKRARQAGPGRGKPLIVAAGCVAQAEGGEIAARAPAVDVVVGPLAYHRLPALVTAARARAEAGGAGPAVVDTDMPAEGKFGHLPARRPTGASAFLTIQEGCDKFCTFCVVPYTRGPEVSRPLAALVAEAEALVAGGAVEITLIGQNVNAWSDGAADFATLLRAVAAVPGLARLRYTTSHPRDMNEALLRAHAEVPALMPYLHLPVQSGSSRVLKAMNRAHTRESYLETLRALRAVRPDIALSGDFIVGFPGETEADFEDTLSIVEEVGYAQAYSFKYSPRPGTPAAAMAGQLDEAVKDARLARLQAAIGAQALAFNKATVGRRTTILLERPGRKPGQLIGKTPWLQSAVIEQPGAKIGDLVEIEIMEGFANSVAARPLVPAAA